MRGEGLTLFAFPSVTEAPRCFLVDAAPPVEGGPERPMSASGEAVGVVLWWYMPCAAAVDKAGGSMSTIEGASGRSAGDMSGEKKSLLLATEPLPMAEKTLAGVMAGDSSGVCIEDPAWPL